MASILGGSSLERKVRTGLAVDHGLIYDDTYFQGFELLTNAVAANAFHDSDSRVDAPQCHENTRVAVIEKIMDWVTNKIDTEAFIMWIYGPAGAGKSAIARTIAELCVTHSLLLASFFFFRRSSGRNTMKTFSPSIAYRVACEVPAARALIETIIENDPLILSSSLETQFTKLVLDPLHILSEQGHFLKKPLPPLIIIDGLDECLDQEAQIILVQFLSSSATRYQLPLKFLIASRPKTHLKFAFVQAGLRTTVFHLQLNKDFCPDKDIRRLLQDKFRDIVMTHPFRSSIPSTWPGKDKIIMLVRKASGQFIYASLVIRFVNFARDSPVRRLDIVFELRPPISHDLPFAELDTLYIFILSSVPDKELILNILAVFVAIEPEYFDLQCHSYPQLESAEQFFAYLKVTVRHELYHHHVVLFRDHVLSHIEARTGSEQFHLISTVWFILQRPFKYDPPPAKRMALCSTNKPIVDNSFWPWPTLCSGCSATQNFTRKLVLRSLWGRYTELPLRLKALSRNPFCLLDSPTSQSPASVTCIAAVSKQCIALHPTQTGLINQAFALDTMANANDLVPTWEGYQSPNFSGSADVETLCVSAKLPPTEPDHVFVWNRQDEGIPHRACEIPLDSGLAASYPSEGKEVR
ncbi:unnamed protein product [Cyclocybe aegerita]|uniref:NACHT domain-containing protein n=1 Tax=Cyclocybe aegerita TaxID=1973307 RepID=A0A8S0XPL2_CYCAE|nr:unnamed protein product [Cyclocybe aegerita]